MSNSLKIIWSCISAVFLKVRELELYGTRVDKIAGKWSKQMELVNELSSWRIRHTWHWDLSFPSQPSSQPWDYLWVGVFQLQNYLSLYIIHLMKWALLRGWGGDIDIKLLVFKLTFFNVVRLQKVSIRRFPVETYWSLTTLQKFSGTFESGSAFSSWD